MVARSIPMVRPLHNEADCCFLLFLLKFICADKERLQLDFFSYEGAKRVGSENILVKVDQLNTLKKG